MMGESHFILGAVTAVTGLATLGYTPANVGVGRYALAIGLGALVALLPDIDSPNTLIRQLFGVGRDQARRNMRRWQRQGWLVVLLNLVRLLISWLLDGLAWLFPHRGPTHWLIVAVALTWGFHELSIWYGWPLVWWRAFALGYVSHLIGDSVTIAGVKLLMPFYDKAVGFPLKFLRVRTGSWQEQIWLWSLVGLQLGWLMGL